MLKRCSYASYQPAFTFDQQATKKKATLELNSLDLPFFRGLFSWNFRKGLQHVTVRISSSWNLCSSALQPLLKVRSCHPRCEARHGLRAGTMDVSTWIFFESAAFQHLGEITQQIPTMSDESHESREYWEMNRRPCFGHCIDHSSSSYRDTSRTCCQAVRRCPWDCKTNILPRKTWRTRQ